MRESAIGTFRTWPDVRLESAFGGRADVICSERVFPVLTQLGHLPSRRVYRQTGLSPIKNWTEPIRCQLPNLMATMRRRNFLGVLGGAAAWPLATRAQQTALPVVGMLGASSAASSATPLASFREGLRDAGFI